MITKNPYDENRYEFVELIVETMVISSSMRDDFSALLKTFKENEIPEYSGLVDNGFQKLIEKAGLRLKEKQLDGLFNVTLNIENMYSQTLLFLLSGDGVRLRK